MIRTAISVALAMVIFSVGMAAEAAMNSHRLPPTPAIYSGPKGTHRGFEGTASCKGWQLDKPSDVFEFHGCGKIAKPAVPQLASTAPKSTCSPPYVRCFIMPNSSTNVNGVEIVTNTSGGNPGTPLIIMDHNHAPMAWVNLYGLFSGGDWGKMPGGLICVTNGVMAEAACLTPVGTLELYNQDGTKQTFTTTDIAWIHQQEAAQKAGR